MAWKGIDGRGLTLAQLQDHINGLPATTWASGMTLHNTAAPSLNQRPNGLTQQHIFNLENYFKNERGWSSAPHAFVDDHRVWLFTRFTDKGTHSPSWNGTRIGIEMLGDFRRGSDDDDSGRGLKVKQNTVALFAMLHTKYGWDPENIKLHYEDPLTNHACPGNDIDKDEFIGMVQEYMGEGGDHDITVLPIGGTPPPKPPGKRGTVNVPANVTLNLRAGSGASSLFLEALTPGAVVEVIGEAMNGATKWLRVNVMSGKTGWVAARFIQIKS